MISKISFSKEDIGGDILPILTTGLYRDVLDTLREYIQNSIDAQAKHIELVIDPDTIMVADDGQGMSADMARNAIKLGISGKNPTLNIGFRGIGVYSAFNLCNSLDIFTRTSEETPCFAINFNFKNIRKALLEDQERRKKGEKSSLYLEKLLENDVSVSLDHENTITKKGTRCIMSGLIGHVYQRLNDWNEVVSYLQDVIPLPFDPSFKYKDDIEKRFSDEDYRVVPLKLQISNRRESIYRPYNNSMFTHGGEHPPAYFDISAGRKERFAFAWVCINDARKVLTDSKLRGLLIKKFGFSISGRNYLEHYFGRAVINRRITGEIIVKHVDLIPNAARSDFEYNSTRQLFFQAFPSFIKNVTQWANKLQAEDKAKEVLDEVATFVYKIIEVLPKARRDREELLRLNLQLNQLSEQIRRHSTTLKKIMPDEFDELFSEIKDCQTSVKSALVERKKNAKDFEKEAIRNIQRKASIAKKKKKERFKDIPTNLVAVAEAYGLKMSDELLVFLKYLDEDILQQRLETEEYKEIISSLREFIEERV